MVPLLGATNFTRFWQVREVLRVYNEHKKFGSDRRLHVGVMMSYNTLYGYRSQFTDVFPKKEVLASIFVSEETYNCLHFADYENRSGLCASLFCALRHCGKNLHAIQLDMIWPEPSEIRAFLDLVRVQNRDRKIEIILQVGSKALSRVNNDPDQLVDRLRQYDGIIDRVLLDKSGGAGDPLNAEELLVYARAIKKAFPHMGLVFAGGLGPDTLHLVKPCIEEYPDASIDAEMQLKDIKERTAPFSVERVKAYVINALAMFQV